MRPDPADTAPTSPNRLTQSALVDAYRRMLFLRRFEERAGQLYAMGQIHGFCHLSIGREAIVTGLALAARRGDAVITSHRCHGHALAQGCDAGAVMAELLGRASGLCGGKAGSMHLMSAAHDFFGGHGVVGAPVSIAAGLAFASTYRRSDAVTICTLGEGAMDQGQVYEACNLASRWKLPLVLVIDNDTGAPASGDRALAARATPFGVPGIQVDGVDLNQVHAAATASIARARAGGGPAILEMITYPFRGHANPDAGNTSTRHRTIEEIDPVAQLKARLLANGWVTDDDLKAIDREQRAIVREAVAFAQAAAQPVAASLKRNVVVAA